MKAGKLKYKIELLQPSLIGDEFGSKEETFTHYSFVRTEVIFKGGSKNIVDNQFFNPNSKEFKIYYDANITEQFRILFENKLYKISFLNKSQFDNSLYISAELIAGHEYTTTTTTTTVI